MGFLLLGSVVAAVVKGARIQGSVPGKAPILGLAAASNGFVIGTSDGLLTSPDGKTWTPAPSFEGETLVAGAGPEVVAVTGGRLFRSSDLKEFLPVDAWLPGVTGLAAVEDGTVYAATGDGQIVSVRADGERVAAGFEVGPPQVLALAVADDGRTMLAGDLNTGLWRSENGGSQWSRILQTPIRAALLDRDRTGRQLIATAGGVLWSTRTEPWQFTDLRVGVEALAQTADGYFAVTADRLLFESADGLRWTAVIRRTD